MKKLTISEAKNIATKTFSKLKPVDQADFLLVHSEKVGMVAKMIAMKLDFDSEEFEIAGWVHDIGYAKSFDAHANSSVSMLKELGYDVSDVLVDCIENHGVDKLPETDEGRVFQVADNLSFFDIDLIGVILKHENFPFKKETLEFLEKMAKGGIDLVRKFTKENEV